MNKEFIFRNRIPVYEYVLRLSVQHNYQIAIGSNIRYSLEETKG